jgi:hypothetical protein
MPSIALATEGKPVLLSVDFFAWKNKRSETERAKDALHSSQSDGGLYGIEREKTMFYTYILRSLSHPDQRYIGSTSDLKSRLIKHNFRRSSTHLKIQTVENRSLFCV